ncbi:hypothetical protein ACRQF6_01470 [Actinotignum sp. GS-2025f]|uniref:hypothetical protein n=1 Tax=unclassified Actinotignum TaxID=2632702 RepID=UPI002A80F52E|nr:hypothetical protein [Actinotignum sp. SLA_B059]MDY5127481.1 hypothetical protein [Actinotignum sp. SLA_B059]
MNAYKAGKIAAGAAVLGGFLGYPLLYINALDILQWAPEFSLAIWTCTCFGMLWVALGQVYFLGVYQWFGLLEQPRRSAPAWLRPTMQAIPVTAAVLGVILLVFLIIKDAGHPSILILMAALWVLSLGASAVARLMAGYLAGREIPAEEKLAVPVA